MSKATDENILKNADKYMDELYMELRELLPDDIRIDYYVSHDDGIAKFVIGLDKYDISVDPVRSILKNGYMIPAKEFASVIFKELVEPFTLMKSGINGIVEGKNIIVRLIPGSYVPIKDIVRGYVAEGIDIAVYVQLSNDGKTATYTPLTKSMYDGLDDTSFNNMIKMGINTTSTLYPPVIMEFDPSDDIFGIKEIEFFDWCERESSSTEHVRTICLTTKNRMNGAVAACYPGVLKKIAEKLKSDLYLVFTSVHEVMIHSVNELLETGFASDDLLAILTETMDEATPEPDVLTHDIYKYVLEKHVIERVVFNGDTE